MPWRSRPERASAASAATPGQRGHGSRCRARVAGRPRDRQSHLELGNDSHDAALHQVEPHHLPFQLAVVGGIGRYLDVRGMLVYLGDDEERKVSIWRLTIFR